MNLYLETSAIAKPYLSEPGDHLVRAAVEMADVVAASVITLPEMASAIYAGQRRGLATAEQVSLLWERFSNDWSGFYRLSVEPAITELAAQLIRSYPLRGYDAVHLASALWWQEQLGEGVVMLTFDKQIRRVGVDRGLWLLPEDGDIDAYAPNG